MTRLAVASFLGQTFVSGLLALSVLVGLLVPSPRAEARPREPAAPLLGVAQRVVDGDSLWFTPAGQAAVEVRLADMDAPELCQAHGSEAKAALAALVLNKPAQLRGVARDQHGRLVARIDIDGVSVATRMVEEGHAWSARQRNDRGPLLKQERMARALLRGLHAVPGAVMPREFRRSHGPCGAVDSPPVPPAARGR
jgi:endonuclease YncB( thermonuclease family)